MTDEPRDPPERPDEPATRRLLGLEWPARVTSAERRTLVAGGLGWMLDAMDAMLYALVLVEIQHEFRIGNATAGALQTAMLLASAIGGGLFGLIADRIGRSRALIFSILVYSVASGASGLAQGILTLAVCRFVLGLGMGGEWSTGATLIAETWRPQHRAKALGLMQSSYAIGEMIAFAVVAFVLPAFGWRAVFFVGVVPALLVLWIRRSVPEPELWHARPKGGGAAAWRRLVQDRPTLRNALLATLMNALGMFGYWGLFSWIPKFFEAAPEEGGRGLSLMKATSWLIVMGVGKFLGYALFGFLSDRFGRRRCYVAYLLLAGLLVPVFELSREPWQLLLLGPLVAFCGTGFFSGYSALASELFPTSIRATAMGFSYNVGRGIAATAPWIVGLATGAFQDDPGHKFTVGFLIVAGAYLLAALLAALLPDARRGGLAELDAAAST